MSERNVSKSQVKWIKSQLDIWRNRELLSEEQAQQVLSLYPSPSELSHRNQSLVLLTLMGAAVFLMGLGVLLVVGYNWAAMPDWLKVLLLFVSIVSTQTLALHLRFQRNAKLFSEVCFFAGGLLYGIGIFLVAQIYHLNAHYPAGVFWWALGILPFALCLDSILLHILFVSLLAIWCEMEIVHFSNLGMWFFGRRWESIPNGVYSLTLLTLPGLIWAYGKKSVATVMLYVALLSWWCILQPIATRLSVEAVYFIGLFGAFLLVIAESHPAGDRMAIPFRMFGFLLSGTTLLVMGTWSFNRAISYQHQESTYYVPTLLVIVLTIASIAANKLLRHRRRSPISVMQSIRQVLQRQCLPVGLVLLLIVLLVWKWLINESLLPTFTANVATLSLAGWLVMLGIREDRSLPFSAGVLFFLLWAIVRYIDLFGAMGGMLGAALVFFLCGGVLLGVAIFWNKRGQKQHV